MWHPQILGHLECRPKIYYDIWSMAINSSKLSSFGIPVIPIKPNISVWNPFNNPYNRVLCWVLTEIPTNRQYFWGIILLKSPGNSEFQRFLASLQLLCGAGLVPSAVTFNTGAQGFCSGRPHVGSWSYLMFRYCHHSRTPWKSPVFCIIPTIVAICCSEAEASHSILILSLWNATHMNTRGDA